MTQHHKVEVALFITYNINFVKMSSRRGATSGFPRNAEWERKYDTKIQNLAEVEKKGDMFFLQVWKLQLTYLYLKTGDIKKDGDGKIQEVHMHMVGEPEGFRKAPYGVLALMTMAVNKAKYSIELMIAFHSIHQTCCTNQKRTIKKSGKIIIKYVNDEPILLCCEIQILFCIYDISF
jgi:hypothetical protein